MNDRNASLGATTISLHWVLAVAMIGMLAFGLILEDMARGETKSWLIWWHKSLGVAILVLAIGRLIWRLGEGMPRPLSAMPAWQARVAKATHVVLLLGTLAMPISGMMMTFGSGRAIDVFGLFTVGPFGKMELIDEIGEIVHGLGGKLLIAAIVLHILGALKHQFIDRDGTLARMAGRRVAPATRG
ncbi:MAG: cytochrome b [Hyphomicrobiaceae bacterium]|nr:cytochrome b [Hyphomicrobiaceae bacterium]